MYDRLWEDNPRVKKIQADSKAEGKAEGMAEGMAKGIAKGQVQGEIATLQKMLVHIISLRFPALTELVQQRVKQLNKSEELDRLVEQAAIAPDEATARQQLLGSPTA